MALCPYCMTAVDGPVCLNCRKPVAYTADAWVLPAGASPDGHGRYQVGAVLGQGGFGITYIGIEKGTGQRVAIKEYFPGQCAQRSGSTVVPLPGKDAVYAGGRKNFLYESKTLYEVRDIPSVVQVRNYFEANNTAYLVMEYLSGQTLEQKIKSSGAIPIDDLRPRLYTLVNDLAKLHAKNIVHRDISPDNIMWMPDGTLKIMDFGSAKSMEDGKSVTVLLKHGFAPVEQYTRHGQGPWTDVYALCATVYYCLTGRVAPMSPERLENDTLIPPSKLGVKLSQQQEHALLWGLTVQPKVRPANMGIFGKAFFGGYRPPTGGGTKIIKEPLPPTGGTIAERFRRGWERLKAYYATEIGGAVIRILLALLALTVFVMLLRYI